jgi:hypothetical protein
MTFNLGGGEPHSFRLSIHHCSPRDQRLKLKNARLGSNIVVIERLLDGVLPSATKLLYSCRSSGQKSQYFQRTALRNTQFNPLSQHHAPSMDGKVDKAHGN